MFLKQMSACYRHHTLYDICTHDLGLGDEHDGQNLATELHIIYIYIQLNII